MPRLVPTAVVATALLIAGVCTAAAQPYLGRTVSDVRVEVAGVPLNDPAVIELVETRIGEPLTMINIRSTIDHLVGLGRFEDVRIFASPSDQGVDVRWLLMPVRRIGTIEVDGNAELSEQSIRTELTDRFGAQPSASRVPDMAGALEAFYADRGYRQASILPRLESNDPLPERVTLVLTVNAGARASVRGVTVKTTPLVPETEVVRRLNLQAGRPFDRTALDARITEYE